MLLRWFVNLYDLEIIEEDAFLTWKEDLSQDNPGKGKALFQVRQAMYLIKNDHNFNMFSCLLDKIINLFNMEIIT